MWRSLLLGSLGWLGLTACSAGSPLATGDVEADAAKFERTQSADELRTVWGGGQGQDIRFDCAIQLAIFTNRAEQAVLFRESFEQIDLLAQLADQVEAERAELERLCYYEVPQRSLAQLETALTDPHSDVLASVDYADLEMVLESSDYPSGGQFDSLMQDFQRFVEIELPAAKFQWWLDNEPPPKLETTSLDEAKATLARIEALLAQSLAELEGINRQREEKVRAQRGRHTWCQTAWSLVTDQLAADDADVLQRLRHECTLEPEPE